MVIRSITCVLKHITCHGIVSLKVVLIKFLSAEQHFGAAADVLAASPQHVANGADVNMFIWGCSPQFNTLLIVHDDYPGIMELRGEKRSHLMCVYARLTLRMGQYGINTNVMGLSLWLSVRLLLSDIHFQKWKSNRRL